MNCDEIKLLLHAYVDNELELLKNLEVERHLQECPACARAHEAIQAVRATIQREATYFAVPAGLKERIQAAAADSGRTEPAIHVLRRSWLALAAAVLLALIGGWVVVRGLPSRPGAAFLTEELVASHVRSQMLASHRFDVESSDRHTVKPWFDGKLDFSPSVFDLSAEGFPLAGGRLDYVDQRPVAALVYYRRKHLINLFIWPTEPGSDRAPELVTRQGYYLVHWAQAGMTHWAISNLNMAELQQFARLFQDKSH